MNKLSVALVVLTLVNVISLIRHGFDALTMIAVILSAVCLLVQFFDREKTK
jgi:hypothetical protein